jgi:hypothetical protein
MISVTGKSEYRGAVHAIALARVRRRGVRLGKWFLLAGIVAALGVGMWLMAF